MEEGDDGPACVASLAWLGVPNDVLKALYIKVNSESVEGHLQAEFELVQLWIAVLFRTLYPQASCARSLWPFDLYRCPSLEALRETLHELHKNTTEWKW